MNGTLSGILSILVWSSTAVFIFFTGNIPGLLLAFITLFIGFIVLTAYQFIRKEDVVSYWNLPLKDYLFVISGVGIYTALFYISFKLVSPFEANTLNYIWPILLVVSTSFIYQKAFPLRVLLGGFLGFGGVVCLFLPRDELVFFSNFEWGHLIAILAAVVWSVYSALARDRHYPQGIMAPVFLYSSLISLFLHFLFEETILPQGWEWLFVVILGVLRIAYSFWDFAMKKGNVVLLASLSNFIPLFSLTLLVLAGGEPRDSFVGVGSLLIVIGCIVVNFDKMLMLFKRKKS